MCRKWKVKFSEVHETVGWLDLPDREPHILRQFYASLCTEASTQSSIPPGSVT